jgi:opacity protein-like surface antigen
MILTRVAAAAALLTLPSVASAGMPYVGLDFGLSSGRANDLDESVTYQTDSGTPPAGVDYDDVFSAEYHHGVDVDVVAGYDFGLIRLEGELGHKRSGISDAIADDVTDQFLSEVNDTLGRTGSATLTTGDFQPGGTLKVNTVTANLLFDVGLGRGITVSGGGGLGQSYARGFGGHDSAGTWQYLLGARYAVSKKVDLGLKYRYFNSGMLNLVGDPVEFAGEGGVDARITPTMHGRFRSRNLQLSMVYNFR